MTRPQQAFDRFLKEGKRAFVKFEGLSLKETIDVIHQSKGFAVLAHRPVMIYLQLTFVI